MGLFNLFDNNSGQTNSGQTSSSEIYSNELSSNHQKYHIRVRQKELRRGGGFVPLFLLGWFPLKTQKTIAYGTVLIGLCGSFFAYQNYSKAAETLPQTQHFLSQQLLGFKEKDVKLKNLSVGASEDYLTEIFEALKSNAYLTQFSQNLLKFSQTGELAAFEIESLVRKINSLNQMYSSQVVFPLEKQIALQKKLTALSEQLKTIEKNIASATNTQVGISTEREALLRVHAALKEQISFLENRRAFEIMKADSNAMMVKNTELLKLVNEYGRATSSLEHRNAYRQLQTLNVYFRDYGTFIRQLNESGSFIDNGLFSGIVKDLELVYNDFSNKATEALSKTFFLKLSLFLLFAGVIMSLLVWMKQYEYNWRESLGILNKLENGLREIETDIEQHNKNASHRIKTEGKTSRLESLSSGLNVSWDRESNRNVFELKQVQMALKNLQAAKMIFDKANLTSKNNVHFLTREEKNLETLEQISIHFTNLNDLVSKEELRIKAKNKALLTYIDETKDGASVWFENSNSAKDKMNFITESLKTLLNIAKDVTFLAEEGEVLSYNANILSRKTAGNDNKSFVEISSRIENLSGKYSRLAENISGLVENLQTNFKTVDLLLKNMNQDAKKTRENALLMQNKVSHVEEQEALINQLNEQLYLMLKKLNVTSLSQSVSKVVSEEKSQDNYQTEFEFNYKSGIELLGNLKDKVDLGDSHE